MSFVYGNGGTRRSFGGSYGMPLGGSIGGPIGYSGYGGYGGYSGYATPVSYTAPRTTAAPVSYSAPVSTYAAAAPVSYAQPAYASPAITRPATYSAPMMYSQPTTYSAPVTYTQPTYTSPSTYTMASIASQPTLSTYASPLSTYASQPMLSTYSPYTLNSSYSQPTFVQYESAPAPTAAAPIDRCVATCLCGACQVETKGKPKWVCNCHCSQCRRALSCAYATLAGFDPDDVQVIKGQANLVSHTTGKEERFSCKICSAKVYAHLHHLNHKAIYNDMFTTPNHGPDGRIAEGFEPSMHIFYPSGSTNVYDGLPKYADLPAAFGGSDQQVPEDYHKPSAVSNLLSQFSPAVQSCTAGCICGACEVQTMGGPKWVCNCHCSQCRRAMSGSYGTLAGFDPENIVVTKGAENLVSYTTGKEERFSCKKCSSKVYAHLHHLNHKAIYNDMFKSPNHGPDGKIGKEFMPTMHIFYTSGNTNVCDGLPKFKDLPAAFGGSDQQVDEIIW